MANKFSQLPLEIVFMILAHVPVTSLLSFGATCKSNYIYHTLCMRKLHLAIFHKQVHAMAAFLGASAQLCSKEPLTPRQSMMVEGYKVRIVLPQDVNTFRPPQRIFNHTLSASARQKTRKHRRAASTGDKGYFYSVSCEQTIRAQNKAFAEILGRYGPSLDDLEFMAYNLNEEGATALGTSCGTKLRHLALRFEHPYVRDVSLSQRYWTAPAPGSPAWNSLIGIGPLKRGESITNLESLVLERAGITPWQLRMLVKRNKNLKVLKLRTCAAVQPVFLNWLGGVSTPGGDEDGDDEKEQREHGEPAPGASIVVLCLENCNSIRTIKSTGSEQIEDIDVGLEWVQNLKALQSLSLRECRNVDAKVVQEANDLLWHISELHLSESTSSRFETPAVIEIE